MNSWEPKENLDPRLIATIQEMNDSPPRLPDPLIGSQSNVTKVGNHSNSFSSLKY